ncbi:MAG: hypothetical protein CMP83_09450 [Gammaproteobacteria bacterium]|nr:hypothetical protein [Gammaproteobacteria bacterium]
MDMRQAPNIAQPAVSNVSGGIAFHEDILEAFHEDKCTVIRQRATALIIVPVTHKNCCSLMTSKGGLDGAANTE